MIKYILLLFGLLINVSAFAQAKEDIKYTLIDKEFYRGSNGKMYIKTKRLIAPKKYSPAFYREVPEIDLKSYENYDEIDTYAKDKNHVYWREITKEGDYIRIIEKADPKTFVIVVPRKLAYDKTSVFQDELLKPSMSRDSLVNIYDLK